MSRVVRGPELLHVVGMRLRLLHAEDVGLLGVEILEEVLPQHGAQAVHIPGDDFHDGRACDETGRATQAGNTGGAGGMKLKA